MPPLALAGDSRSVSGGALVSGMAVVARVVRSISSGDSRLASGGIHGNVLPPATLPSLGPLIEVTATSLLVLVAEAAVAVAPSAVPTVTSGEEKVASSVGRRRMCRRKEDICSAVGGAVVAT